MGVNWIIRFYHSARRELRSIQDEHLKAKIIEAIFELAEDPRPADAVELERHNRLYRIRIDAWRVVYAVSEAERIILIVRIRPRQDAYIGL